MVKGEYGITLRINTGIDLTGYSAIALAPRRPGDNTPVNVDNNSIVVGSVDVVAELTRTDGVKIKKTFIANNYIEYITRAGEFDVEGDYPSDLIIDFGPDKRLKSRETNIFVDA